MDAQALSFLAAAVAALTPLEIAGVVFGVLYLVLAIRQNILCWPAALIGVLLSLVVFWEAKLYMEAALQVFYAAMAIYGWRQWRAGGGRALESNLPVGVWPWHTHALTIGGILAASAVFGAALSYTDAAYPYLDSFSTVAAIVTTYMVAKKILENWIYWFVIDSIGVYLYTQRELYLYAALFVLYLVLIVIGYMRWLRDWRADRAPVPA